VSYADTVRGASAAVLYNAAHDAARGDRAGDSAGLPNITDGGAYYNSARGAAGCEVAAAYNTARGASAGAPNVADRGDDTAGGDEARGDSAGVLNNKAGCAAFCTARGADAGASNVTARGDDTARGDKARGDKDRGDKARGLNTPGASNNTPGAYCTTAGGSYYSKARGAVAGASNVAARGDDTARGDKARGDTAGGDTVRGASIGGATSNITAGGDITAGSDSVAPGSYNTSQGTYYTDISGGASPLSLPPLPMLTSNTPTARGFYGQSFSSEEVIEEAYLHIKSHPFRAMKSIITKCRCLASTGKTRF
jgi:hypothetical protein